MKSQWDEWLHNYDVNRNLFYNIINQPWKVYWKPKIDYFKLRYYILNKFGEEYMNDNFFLNVLIINNIYNYNFVNSNLFLIGNKFSENYFYFFINKILKFKIKMKNYNKFLDYLNNIFFNNSNLFLLKSNLKDKNFYEYFRIVLNLLLNSSDLKKFKIKFSNILLEKNIKITKNSQKYLNYMFIWEFLYWNLNKSLFVEKGNINIIQSTFLLNLLIKLLSYSKDLNNVFLFKNYNKFNFSKVEKDYYDYIFNKKVYNFGQKKLLKKNLLYLYNNVNYNYIFNKKVYENSLSNYFKFKLKKKRIKNIVLNGNLNFRMMYLLNEKIKIIGKLNKNKMVWKSFGLRNRNNLVKKNLYFLNRKHNWWRYKTELELLYEKNNRLNWNLEDNNFKSTKKYIKESFEVGNYSILLRKSPDRIKLLMYDYKKNQWKNLSILKYLLLKDNKKYKNWMKCNNNISNFIKKNMRYDILNMFLYKYLRKNVLSFRDLIRIRVLFLEKYDLNKYSSSNIINKNINQELILNNKIFLKNIGLYNLFFVNSKILGYNNINRNRSIEEYNNVNVENNSMLNKLNMLGLTIFDDVSVLKFKKDIFKIVNKFNENFWNEELLKNVYNYINMFNYKERGYILDSKAVLESLKMKNDRIKTLNLFLEEDIKVEQLNILLEKKENLKFILGFFDKDKLLNYKNKKGNIKIKKKIFFEIIKLFFFFDFF